MSSYQSCNIKRDLIHPIITEFVGDNAVVSTTTVSERTTYSIKFSNNTAKTALLLVYHKNDGTTTIQYGTGKNPAYSRSLADEIISRASITLINVKHLYFKKITGDDFDKLINLLSVDGANISEPNILINGKQYHITGENGEVLHLVYYNNLAICFQGRPSVLFNNTIEKLLEFFPTSDVVKELLGYYNINIPKEDFENELETLYPNIGNIDEKVKAILLPSIALKRAALGGLDDYSYIAYPALRGLEGALKLVFKIHGIIIENKTGFGEYFTFNHTKQKWEAAELTVKNINSSEIQNRLTVMYTAYYNHRHGLFHVDTLTPKLTSQEDAILIVDEVLNIINDNCVLSK